jgi:hypothetical protein
MASRRAESRDAAPGRRTRARSTRRARSLSSPLLRRGGPRVADAGRGASIGTPSRPAHKGPARPRNPASAARHGTPRPRPSPQRGSACRGREPTGRRRRRKSGAAGRGAPGQSPQRAAGRVFARARSLRHAPLLPTTPHQPPPLNSPQGTPDAVADVQGDRQPRVQRGVGRERHSCDRGGTSPTQRCEKRKKKHTRVRF